MGVVNVTPDSFSDGGRYLSPGLAVEHALELADQGADILDIGGESTRPGADPVPEAEELDRVVPVIEALCGCGVAISVDTMKPGVMRAALAAGADMVNDVNAFRAEGALTAVAPGGAGICLVHMQGAPRTMQENPDYRDVVAEVDRFLKERVAAAEDAGIVRDRMLVDPGFGFGKTVAHNLRLLKELDRIAGIGLPVLVGLSRKSVLGAVTGRGTGDREYAGLAAAILAIQKGAGIVRVHDVAAMRDATRIMQAVENV